MTGIESLIYTNNIRNKVIALDLDGTLLWGDLGETVFFLTLAMEGFKAPLEDLPVFLKKVNEENLIRCSENRLISEMITQYMTYLHQNELVRAYGLTADYLAGFSKEDIYKLSLAVLRAGIPSQQFRLNIGSHMFDIRIHAMPDPLMTQLIKDSYLKGADIRIISGSPQPVVEGYCLFQGLPIHFARGAGKDKQGITIIPFGKKKLEILAQEGFPQPYIAVGDSPGDFDMLTAAEHSFVRRTSPKEVLDEAQFNHWQLI